MTFKKVNKAIAFTGLTLIRNGRGAGYFYFLDADGDQVGESVMVCYLGQLSLEQWVETAESALAQNVRI